MPRGRAAAALALLTTTTNALGNHFENERFDAEISRAEAECAAQKAAAIDPPATCCGCCTIFVHYRWQHRRRKTLWNAIGWPGTQDDFIPPSGSLSFVEASGAYFAGECKNRPPYMVGVPSGMTLDAHHMDEIGFPY